MPILDEGRWPSIYSLDDLKRAARSLVDRTYDDASFDARFYDLGSLVDPLVCQGDIVELRAPLPMLDAAGEPVAYGDEYDHWLVFSNSCDHERSTSVQMVPLVILGAPDAAEVEQLRRYEYARRFYIPPWPGCPDTSHRIADFLLVTTIEIEAFRTRCARVVGRMLFPSWAVLHTCLVMYLARDDGRND